MNLFTWFFVVPGVLLVAIGVVGLFGDRKSTPVADAVPSTSTTESDEDHKVLVSSTH